MSQNKKYYKANMKQKPKNEMHVVCDNLFVKIKIHREKSRLVRFFFECKHKLCIN